MNFHEEFAQRYHLAPDTDFWYHAQSGALIIKHDAVVRIADQEGIAITITSFPEASDDHKCVLVTASHNDKICQALGECAVGTKGITAQYPWAMAQKRAEDRAVLRLVAPGGAVYSDVEAEDFRKGGGDPQRQADAEPRRAGAARPAPQPSGGGVPGGAGGGYSNPRPVDQLPDGVAVPQNLVPKVLPGDQPLGFGKNKMMSWQQLMDDEEGAGYISWLAKSAYAKHGEKYHEYSDREITALFFATGDTPF